MKKVKKLSTLATSMLLSSSLALSISPFASAEEVNPNSSNLQQSSIIESNNIEQQSSVDDAANKARLDAIMEEAQKVWKTNSSESAVEDYLKSKNLTIVDTGKSVISPLSNNNSVNIDTPTIAYDNISGWYSVVGTMSWKKIGTTSTKQWYYDTAGAADADVIGISLGDGKNSSFQNKGYSLTIYDVNKTPTSIVNAEKQDNSGVIWRAQDKFTGESNYNIDSYFAVLYVKYVGPGKNIAAYNTYGHTYYKLGVNSFGFSPYGLEIGFNDVNYGWKATSFPKYFN